MALAIIEHSFQVIPGAHANAQDNDVSVIDSITRDSIDFQSDEQRAGTNVTSEDEAAYSVFDLSGYNRAHLDAAKLTLRAYETLSTDFTMWLSALSETESVQWGTYHPHSGYNHRSGRLCASVFDSGAPLSASNLSHVDGNMWMRMHMDRRNNLDHVLDQTLTISADGDVSEVKLRMKRFLFFPLGTGAMWVELWAATGYAGNYKADTLISSGEVNALPLSTITAAWQEISFTPHAGTAPSVAENDVIIVRFVLETDGNHHAQAFYDVSVSTESAAIPELGLHDNIFLHAGPGLLTGFALSTNFLTAKDIRATRRVTDADAFLPHPLHTFTEGELVTIGDAYWSPDVEIDLADLVAKGWADGGSDWLCLALQSYPAFGSGLYRSWHSSRSGVETIDGKYGMVLTLRFVIPHGRLDANVRNGATVRLAMRTGDRIGAEIETRGMVSDNVTTGDTVECETTHRNTVDMAISTRRQEQ